MSKFTKQRIMDSFLDLLNKKSMDRLTVKDVIEVAEVNHNTFYYHFEDIYDLLNQVFVTKFENFCNETREQEATTFYDEYLRAAEFIFTNKNAMQHVYHSKDKELIQQYLERVTKMFVRHFVKNAAIEYDISEEGIDYLTNFYSNAIIGDTMHWIQDGMPPYRENHIFLISKSFEDSIENMIQSYLKYS